MARASRDAAEIKIPIGIPSIDSRLHGGVRPGTTILAMGECGTGYHEFLRTATIMHGNWQAGTELFDLEYGEVDDRVVKPSQVRYVAVTDSEKTFRRNVLDLADRRWAEAALEHVTLSSLAEEVAGLGPLVPSADGNHLEYSREGSTVEAYEAVFERFDDLIEAEPGEVVIVDALSDFLPITAKILDTVDLYFIAQTLCYLTAELDSVLIVAADAGTLSPEQRALLRRTFEAVLDFDWFGSGTQQRRTLTVTEFPEFWREYDAEGRVTFDLNVDRDHFGISRTEKIAASDR